MSDSDQPPASYTRELSPEEERAALINFMGSTYGELKSLDSNIIGQTPTLQAGQSEKIKRQIENIVSKPTNATIVPAQSDAGPMPHDGTAPLEPSAAPIHAGPAIIRPPVLHTNATIPVDDDQMSLNFDVDEKAELFDKLDSIEKRLRKNTETLNMILDLIEPKTEAVKPKERKSKDKSA